MSSYKHRDETWLMVLTFFVLFAAGAGYLWAAAWARDALSPGEWWWSAGLSYASVALLVLVWHKRGARDGSGPGLLESIFAAVSWLAVVVLVPPLLLVVLGGGSLGRRLLARTRASRAFRAAERWWRGN